MPLGFLRRKKKEEVKTEEKKPETKSLLEELCGNDLELYQALSRTVLLNPAQLEKQGIDSLLNKAKDYEEKKDYLRAEIEYRTAGGLSIYLGNLNLVQKCFKKCAELNPTLQLLKFYENKNNAEKALGIAKEFYARTLKTEEKKT